MFARLLFTLVVCLITGALVVLAVLLPPGPLAQVVALAALFTGMVALLVLFMSAAELFTRWFSTDTTTTATPAEPASCPAPARKPRRAA